VNRIGNLGRAALMAPRCKSLASLSAREWNGAT
jgi:hypothetical protein